MYDLDQIRQLVDMMVANDLVEVSIRSGDAEVNLRRPNPAAAITTAMTLAPAPIAGPIPVNSHPAPSAEAPPVENAEPALIEIGSPMVGTFYASPDPDSPPFVQVGSTIHPGTVVCILEAMKVFNEIKAEVSGTIQRVLVKNGQAVEYGQPLFLVRPH